MGGSRGRVQGVHPLHPPPRSAHTTLPNLFNSKMAATNSENLEYSLAKAI